MNENDLSTRAFRVALVGCGRISQNHFDAIEEGRRPAR